MALASARDIWLDPAVAGLSPAWQTYIIGHELYHVLQQRFNLLEQTSGWRDARQIDAAGFVSGKKLAGRRAPDYSDFTSAFAGGASRTVNGLVLDPLLEMQAEEAGLTLSQDGSALRELPGMLKSLPRARESPAGGGRCLQPALSCTFEIDLSNVRIAHIEIGERPGDFTGLGAKIEKQKDENINHIVAWDLIQKGLRRTLKGKTLREVWQWLDQQNNWWDQSKPKGGGGINRFHAFAQFRGEGQVFGQLLEVVDNAMNEWIYNAYSWNMNLWAGPGKENQAKGRLFALEKARIKRILSQDCYLKDAPCWLETELRYEARDASRQRLVPVILEFLDGKQLQDNTGKQAISAGKLPDGAYLVKTLYPTHKILNLQYHPTGNAGIIPFLFPTQGVGAFAFIKATGNGATRVSIHRVSRDFHLKDALTFESTKKTTIENSFFGTQAYTTADALRNSFLQHVIDIPPKDNEYWQRQGVDAAFKTLKDWATAALADSSTTVPRFGSPASRFL